MPSMEADEDGYVLHIHLDSAAVASAMRIIGINSVCSSEIRHQTF